MFDKQQKCVKANVYQVGSIHHMFKININYHVMAKLDQDEKIRHNNRVKLRRFVVCVNLIFGVQDTTHSITICY